ncbi:MAG TPA: aminotransferase class I/II-fold pyridoxal phosphate-dependent enzyme [Terriglobales bacterium]|nr:aminotransferase class I/II-fold pyridoxal phosphate-dependent enzyme [Terriglobales bacterium]
MANQFSILAQQLRGSAILGIADEVRALVASGQPVLNLTVGDFNPKQFPIPFDLEEALVAAVRGGESNYPPPNGVEALRRAIMSFHARAGGVAPELNEILVAAGARPAIYALYRALVDPGDRVVFGVPNWNNEYYCELVSAQPVAVRCDASTGFLPTAEALRPHLRGARLLALNSPLNPAGSGFSAEQLGAICDAVLEENARRGEGERPLYLFYDQVYWMITTPGTTHHNPVTLRPAIAKYTVIVDAISKAFAATGLRVGWAIAPAPIIRAMNNINGHVGAWAPRPEQIATAKLLADDAAVDRAVAVMRREAAARLQAVYDGLMELKGDGFAVDCLKPQGAIYASARFALHGQRTSEGAVLTTDDDIRRYLLQAANLAVVPFGAFGAPDSGGWMRLSIGVASPSDIEQLMPRLRSAFSALLPQTVAAR